MSYIPLTSCKHRVLYRLSSRNLWLGVFNQADNSFIGIREKGGLYLFPEYHWDCGPPFGTVRPQEEVGVLPDEIELRTHEPTVDQYTSRLVAFDRTRQEDKMKGWYFTDTNEYSRSIRPVARLYRPLFDYLKTLDPVYRDYQPAIEEE